MGLQVGDLVQTEAGEVGRIVYISRLTAFVEFNLEDPEPKPDTLRAHLLSALTLVEPPSAEQSE